MLFQFTFGSWEWQVYRYMDSTNVSHNFLVLTYFCVNIQDNASFALRISYWTVWATTMQIPPPKKSISMVFFEGLKLGLARSDFKAEELKAIWAFALYSGSSKFTNVLIQRQMSILRLKNYRFEEFTNLPLWMPRRGRLFRISVMTGYNQDGNCRV